MVPGGGLEPSRPCGLRILSPNIVPPHTVAQGRKDGSNNPVPIDDFDCLSVAQRRKELHQIPEQSATSSATENSLRTCGFIQSAANSAADLWIPSVRSGILKSEAKAPEGSSLGAFASLQIVDGTGHHSARHV